MYKEKKVSKFAFICCSFLIAMCAMLAINPSWINKFYDDTLCYSSTAPTITLDNFNTTTTNYLSSYDFYITSLSYVTSVSGFTSIGPCFHFAFYYINDSTIGNGGYSYTTSNVTIYTKSLNTFTGEYNLSSNSYSGVNGINGFGQKGGLYVPITSFGFSSIIVFTYNNNYYTAITSDLYFSALVTPTGPTYQDGYNEGYTAGENTGYLRGWNEGLNTGYTNGQNSVLNHPHDYDLYTQSEFDAEYNRGYQIGQDDILVDPNEYQLYTQQQYTNNYDTGYTNGYADGYYIGLNDGFDMGYDTGVDESYGTGFNDGYNDALNNTYTFKDLVFAVVDTPVQVFSSLFNFEILGVNLLNFFTALFTLCVLILLLKWIMRGK